MAGDSPKFGGSSEHALRLIRLRRLAEQQQIPAHLVDVYAARLQPETITPAAATEDEAPITRQAARAACPSQKKVLTERAEEAELILRRLVAAEESWDKMKPYIWEVFDKWPRPEIAAKIAELAYLHGSLDDLLEVFDYYRQQLKSFYFLIDVNLREYMVVRLWIARKEAVLNHFLHQKTFRSYLVPLEHFFVFWSLYAGPQPKRAWQYYQRHQFELQKALHDFGRRLKLSPSYFYLTLGRLAYDQRDERQARQLLEKINRQDAEFPEALDMLIKFDVDLDENGLCAFGRKLALEKSWENRIKLLNDFLDGCRRLEGVKHQERSALNNILADPLRWFPQNAQAWNQVGKTLAKHCDLEYLLPNLMQVFRQKRFDYDSPQLERALWEPLLRLKSSDDVRDHYWRTFALLHQYVATGGVHEFLIWKARRIFHRAVEAASKPLPETWSDIHSKLLSFVSRSCRFEEKLRQQLLVQLKVAGFYLDVQSDDIHAYIEQIQVPNYEILAELQVMVQKREDWHLEVTLLHRLARGTHYRNQDLSRLWELGRYLKQNDLAWRVASVVQARQVLHPDISRVWSLTAERRLDRPFQSLTSKFFDLLLVDFTGDQRKFMDTMLQVGPLLPELMATLSRDLKPMKRPLAKSDWEREFDRFSQRTDWLAPARKLYLPQDQHEAWLIPPFADLLPENRWTWLFMTLAERLGPVTWKWQLSILYGEIEGLLSRLNRGGKDILIPSKVGKWLRALSPSQRKSWYDLGILAKRLSDEQAQILLGCLVARLTTAICSQHTEALDSLALMGAPLAIRWDLERFILSPSYTSIREQQRNLVPLEVPDSLPSHCMQTGKI
ncbi:MAG: tetratricopeptide repeat protein [Oligoflexus sp.]